MNDLVFTASRGGDYELCNAIRDVEAWRLSDEIDGSPRLATWRPVEVELVRADENRPLLPSDAPWYGVGSKLIFKPSVILAMGTFLRSNGEILPLNCKDATLAMYNPTRVIDALDEAKSTITRFRDGRIMMIKRHVFHRDKIANVDVFKLPMRASDTYVSQRFVDLWMSHGLKGLAFEHV